MISKGVMKLLNGLSLLMNLDYGVDFSISKDDKIISYATNIEDSEDMMEIIEQGKDIETSPVHEWDFNFDGYLFAELEQGAKIESISLSTHIAIWHDLYEHEAEFNYKDGIQKYLLHCKNNNINIRTLAKYDSNLHDISHLLKEEIADVKFSLPNKFVSPNWLIFLSHGNTLMIENENDFDKFHDFLKNLGLEDHLKKYITFQKWQHLAVLNHDDPNCIIFEFDPYKGLTFGWTKEKSLEWFGIEPFKVNDLNFKQPDIAQKKKNKSHKEETR